MLDSFRAWRKFSDSPRRHEGHEGFGYFVLEYFAHRCSRHAGPYLQFARRHSDNRMSLSTLGRPVPCRVVVRVASCILILAPSGAVPDGIDPSRKSDHALRVDWQSGLYSPHKPLAFFSGKTFSIAADRRGKCRNVGVQHEADRIGDSRDFFRCECRAKDYSLLWFHLDIVRSRATLSASSFTSC